MAPTLTPQGSLRQRHPGGKKIKESASGASSDVEIEKLVTEKKVQQTVGSELDYKVVLAFITGLAFVTRFWGISHPNEVVFDEVHFGKV